MLSVSVLESGGPPPLVDPVFGETSRGSAAILGQRLFTAIGPSGGKVSRHHHAIQSLAIYWAAVNERDDLGDDLPSDYFTHVSDGGFDGWPYSYIGNHVGNRVTPRPDSVAKAIAPDVLLGPLLRRYSLRSSRGTSADF